MKRLNKRLFFACFTLFLSIVFIALLISMTFIPSTAIDRMSVKNTGIYSATVASVSYSPSGPSKSFEIATNEYSASLLIVGSVVSHVGEQNFLSVKPGDKIRFRVTNGASDDLNTVAFVDIVALDIEGSTVLSLEAYNAAIRQVARPARIAGGVAAVLLLLVSLVLFFYRTGNSLRKRTGDSLREP